MSTTSERLRDLMNRRNLRQVEILHLCQPYCQEYDVKIGKSDLSQYVSGKASPRQDKLTILAKALNVSEAWLMGFPVPETRTPEEDAVGPVQISDARESILLGKFRQLNDTGKVKLVNYAEDLLQIHQYQADSSPLGSSYGDLPRPTDQDPDGVNRP